MRRKSGLKAWTVSWVIYFKALTVYWVIYCCLTGMIEVNQTNKPIVVAIVTFSFYCSLRKNQVSIFSFSPVSCVQFMQLRQCRWLQVWQQTVPWPVISDRNKLCLHECELHRFSITLCNRMHKGTLMSPLLSLSRVSFWLQRLSLCPLNSSSLLLSLLSHHWPLSLFLLIPQLSSFSSSPLPSSSSELSSFFSVSVVLSLVPSPPPPSPICLCGWGFL